MRNLLPIAVVGMSMCLASAHAEEGGYERIVLLDNESVLVVENRFMPGAESPLHTHTGPRVTHFLQGGVVELTSENGEPKRKEVPTGRTVWRSPVTHVVKNVGDTDIRILVMELK